MSAARKPVRWVERMQFVLSSDDAKLHAWLVRKHGFVPYIEGRMYDAPSADDVVEFCFERDLAQAAMGMS